MQPNSKSFEEWMEQLTRMYNLDVGIVPGFFKWLGQMLTFNFGDSWLWTKPVTEVFNSCVWISFFMGLIAFVLEIIIAIPLGVIAATKQYSKTDYVISVLALAGISLPTFFFASLLKLVFSVKLGWFDLYGLTGRNHEQLSAFGKLLDMGHHLVLPIVTLVVISVGSLMRYTRTNMLEVLNADFIRTARASNLPRWKIIFVYALRNAANPLFTTLGMVFSFTLGANVLVDISNDGWFGRSPAALQHLYLASLRAVEQGRWLLRGTNTGISAIIDARGRVTVRGGQFEENTLWGRVRLQQGATVYHKLGLWLPLAAGLLWLGIFWGTRRPSPSTLR